MSLFHIPSAVPPVNGEAKTMNWVWIQLFTNIASLLNQGFPEATNNSKGQLVPQSIIIPLAKLTGGGTNGSLTFTNGILTKAVPPT